MKPGTCQRLSDLDLAHGWTQGLQSLDGVSDENRESIHGRSHLNQGIRTFLIQPTNPRSDGGRRDVKHAGCLLQVRQPVPSSQRTLREKSRLAYLVFWEIGGEWLVLFQFRVLPGQRRPRAWRHVWLFFIRERA